MKRLLGIISLALVGTLAQTACDRSQVTYMVGTLERDRIELRVESNEPIVSIHIEDGQRVATGDLVLVQDPQRATAYLAQAAGLYDQAEARLAELKRGPRPELISEARAGLEAARAQRINAAANLERSREVYDRGLSSEGVLDQVETNFKTALAAEKAATESLERLLNGTTVEELQQAVAARDATLAQLEAAQLDLERTRIVAPGPGVVDKVLYQVGERPAAGSTIAVLLSADRSFARVYVPEHLKSSVRPGDVLDVYLDGIDRVFEGKVRWVSMDAGFTPYFALTEHDRSRLSYLAEIDIEGVEELPSGLPLQVDFPVR